MNVTSENTMEWLKVQYRKSVVVWNELKEESWFEDDVWKKEKGSL